MKMKKGKFYKMAFWIAIIIVIALAVWLARIMNKPAENVSYVDLGNLATEQQSTITPAVETKAAETATEKKEAAETKEVATEKAAEEPKAAEKETKDLKILVFKEGDLVSFPNLKAVDPDGDKITYTFSAPIDKDGKWQTKEGDAGNYEVTITASDGQDTISEKVLVMVERKNNAPVIEAAEKVTVKEGETVKLEPTVTDADGDPIQITYSGWMKSSSKATSYTDAGSYEVTITASDGKAVSKKTVSIIVENINRKPEFVSII